MKTTRACSPGHQGGEHGRVAHIATDQPVRPELPDLARVDPGWGGVREDLVGRIIRLLGSDGRQEVVDLRNREARDADVEVEVRGHQCPQFSGEQVLVPAGIECQFVVGEDIGALLGLAQVLDLQTGHRGQAQLGGRSHAAVAGQDRARLVDQHRHGEAELPDTGGDLPDLLRGMRAGIAGPRGEGRQRAMRNLRLGHNHLQNCAWWAIVPRDRRRSLDTIAWIVSSPDAASEGEGLCAWAAGQHSPRAGQRARPTGRGLEGLVHGLEGARDDALASRVVFRPRVEVGLRHDGEDAETSAGLDVGGGLVVSDSSTGLAVDLRVRMLVLHQAEGVRERAMAASLSYHPTSSTPLGVTARVAPSWAGQAASGAEARWGRGLCAWAPASIPRGGEACQSGGHGSRRLSARHLHCT